MTITASYELQELYSNARDGVGGYANTRKQEIAEHCDQVAGELLKSFKEAGIAFPNDDRMYDIELKIFELAMEANQ